MTHTEDAAVAISVIIPARNAGTDLQACLLALENQTFQRFETIVIDDGSTDESAAIAQHHRAQVLRNPTPRGPAASRNTGANAARAPILFFVDADVALHPNALELAHQHFQSNPQLDALFGSYDTAPTAPGLASAFRNLLHHYVHQQGDFQNNARPAHTFWTGCGAMRKHVFLALGGFDPKLYRRPAIEDIELGYRLTRAGHPIALVRNILATHRKRWTLASIVRTDIFHRGVPWMLLLLNSRTKENDLNVNSSQRLSVACAGAFYLALLASPWLQAMSVVALIPLLAIAALNLNFYRFLKRHRGLGFALKAFPLHVIYFTCCGASVAIALALHAQSRRQLFHDAQPRTHDRAHAHAPSTPTPRLNKRRDARDHSKP